MICEKNNDIVDDHFFFFFFLCVDIFDVSLLFVSIPGKEPADCKLILETV